MTRVTQPPPLWGKWYENPQSLVGKTIDEFELVQWLGTGGFAVVYKARRGPAIFAIKILFIEEPWRALAKLQYFAAESEALDIINNERGFVHQVKSSRLLPVSADQINEQLASQIYTQMQHGQVWFYHVLQFIDGGSLHKKLGDNPQGLSPGEAIPILLEAGRHLQRLHEVHSLMHRDICPENILLDTTIRGKTHPLLTDLGLAKSIDPRAASRRITMPAVRSPGKPGFVPPEAEDSVLRDVYAYGITILETVTGLLPETGHQGNNDLYAGWRPYVEDRLDKVPDETLRAIIRKAVAVAQGQRYQSVGQVVAALTRYQESGVRGPTDPPPGPQAATLKDIAAFLQRGWQNAGRSLRRDIAFLRQQVQRYFSYSRWACLVLALAAGLALHPWLAAWSEFYGPGGSNWLPWGVGILTFVWPTVGSLLAGSLLILLWFSLSPALGVLSLAGGGTLAWRLMKMPPPHRRERLMLIWLIMVAPALVSWHLALAVPIAVGVWYRRTGQGIMVALLSYLVLALWATLQGARVLGPELVIDPYGINKGHWYLDARLSTWLDSKTFSSYWQRIWSPAADPWYVLELIGAIWLGSVAPLWGMLSWASAGMVGSILSKRVRLPLTSRIDHAPAIISATLLFAMMSFLLLAFLDLAVPKVVDLLPVILATVVAANLPTIVRYQSGR